MKIGKGIRLFAFGALIASVTLFTAACGTTTNTAKPQDSGTPKAVTSDYPNRAVTLIVAYGPGGTDTTARVLASGLEKQLGQPVTVQNVVGGGGWSGWGQLANAKPDGYTIGYINVPNMFTGYLDPKLKRKENLESFTPIMNHVTDSCVWIVSADSQFKTLKDLIDYAKANPSKITIANHGVGGDDDLGRMQVEKATGAKFSVIQNTGTSDSLTQLLGKHVDVVGANVSEVLSLQKEGKIRVLGIENDKASEFLPNVKTFKEQGVDVVMFAGRGIAAPAGTPADVIAKLSVALQKTINDPAHQAKAKELGLALDVKSGADYNKFLKTNEQLVKNLMGW